MTSEALRGFGFQVRKARLALGWSLEKLADEALGNGDRKGYVSQVEKGKRNLQPETIDKFDQALDLPGAVVKAALMAPPTPVEEEVPVDRNAERLLRLSARDTSTPTTAEALLIALAYEYAPEKPAPDLHSAYTGLRSALETADKIRRQGEMPANTSAQMQRILAEVARLNDLDEREAAAEFLDDEMQRLEAERERVFTLQLDQDRLLNRPDAAAKRLILNLRQSAPAGGVFTATRDLIKEWRKRGETRGDPFDLRTALALAKANHDRARGSQKGLSFGDLGNCFQRLGERAGNDIALRNAIKAFRSELKYHPRHTDPQNWGITQNNLGAALGTLGKREQGPARLRAAIAALQAALEVHTREATPMDWATTQNNLGNALRALGEREQDPARLREAIAALQAAPEVYTRDATPMDWAMTQHNLGIAWRSLARVTRDPILFDRAQTAYDAALKEHTRDKAPYLWADTIGGLGELELDRYAFDRNPAHLDAASNYIATAREVLDEASEVLAARCDALQAQIDAARQAEEDKPGTPPKT